MGIYNTANGRLQVKRRNLSGDGWWCITVTSKEAAKKHDAEMALAFDRGEEWKSPRAREAARQGMTIRGVAAAFLTARAPQLEQKTVLRYGRELDSFVTFAERAKRGMVGDLSRRLLLTFLSDLQRPDRQPPLQPATAAKIVKTVRLFWEWAYDAEADYPEWGVAVPRPQKVELPAASISPRPAPSWSDMDDFLSALEDRPVGEWAVRLAWIQRALGARVSEAVQLRWADLDTDNRTLTFRSATTKARTGGRVLPLPSWLVRRMKTWAHDDEWICGVAGRRTVGTSRGARVFSTAWRDAGVASAIWEGRGTHAIRAGVQTGLTRLGWPADAVRLLVGHQLDELRVRYIDYAQVFDLAALVETIPEPGLEAAPSTLPPPP